MSSLAQAYKTEPMTVQLPKRKPIYEFLKSCFDFVFSLTASIILFIPIIILLTVITIKDFGNPVYIQERMGKNRKHIKVFKLRTMKIGADKLSQTLTPELIRCYEQEFKVPDDPRLIGYKKAGDGSTCFGAKLRKASVDEILQIPMNILIHRNMSVVGPRPILETELKKNYTPEEQKILLSVKPGLTGYWQAYERNNAQYGTGERQKMELYYVAHRSIAVDLKILLKTAQTVIKRAGM